MIAAFALESYAMRRFALLLAVFLSVSVLPSNSQDNDACSYVVKEVSFENRAGLTADQLSTLRKLVIGRCYHPDNAMFISERIYEQLRLWGYCEATVYDPDRFRVLDPSPQSSPIAVVVDFRLTGTGAHPK